MDALTEAMRQLEGLLADAAAAAVSGEALAPRDGEGMLSFLERLGSVLRLLDGLVVEATAQMIERDGAPRDERLTTQSECRDASELLRR